MGKLIVVVTRSLSLCAVLLAIPAVVAAQGVSKQAVSESATPSQEDRYAPTRLGIPETIGGYRVLAILTGDNFTCMRPGEKRLVLRSPQPTIEDGPRDFSKERIEQELQALNLTDYTQWGWEIVGPGVTREQLLRQYEQSYRFFKAHGCPTLGLPTSDKCPFLAGGEVRCEHSAQGFAIIQNLIAPADLDNNGQSVILIAPTVGNNNTARWGVCAPPLTIPGCIPYGWTGGYSAFLNNGMTDTGYFLQVGLYFTNRADRGGNIPEIPQGCVTVNDPGNPFSPEGIGMVVWAGAQTGEGTEAELGAHPLCVPYISGHHYYTTIAYTSGIWWTCAADMQDTTTYRCHPHEGATGTRLINSVAGTNVFAENWNKDAGWASGFPYQWVAYGANIYKEGIGYPWKSETTWTQHSCNNASPPESAIVGGLVPVGSPVNDGYAFFNTYYLPLYCE